MIDAGHRQTPRLAWALLAVGSAIVAFVEAAWAVAPTVRFRPDARAISVDQGFSFKAVVLPDTGTWLYRLRSDDPGDPRASGLRLYEDTRPLGPPHRSHEEIRQKGQGRFSHWGQSLWFSSSDGGDPRSNGRAYTAEVPLTVRARWRLAGVLGLLTAVGSGLLLLGRSGGRSAVMSEWLGARPLPSMARASTRERLILSVSALCFLVASAVAVAECLAPTFTFPLGQAFIAPENGFAHVAQVPNVSAMYRLQSGDGDDHYVSVLKLFEDRVALGPAHSLHDDIRKRGQGRFSHWAGTVPFQRRITAIPRPMRDATQSKRIPRCRRPSLRWA